MSVLIRGMQIPSECSVCPMIQYGVFSGNTWCTLCSINKAVLAMDFKAIQFEGRHKDCPLVDLGSHGDLIDRNEFLVKMNIAIELIKTGMVVLDAKDDKELKMELKTYLDIRDGLKECDVVIKAEGEEE